MILTLFNLSCDISRLKEIEPQPWFPLDRGGIVESCDSSWFQGGGMGGDDGDLSPPLFDGD